MSGERSSTKRGKSAPVRAGKGIQVREQLSRHESDQEFLFVAGRAGRVTKEQFCAAARELEEEAPCIYLEWLLRKRPFINGAA